MIVNAIEITPAARRRGAQEEAQRTLLACIAAEASAEREVGEARDRISEAIKAASDPNGPDETVEAFARWLPGARQLLEEATCRLERLQAETARARANVAICRAALARMGDPQPATAPSGQ